MSLPDEELTRILAYDDVSGADLEYSSSRTIQSSNATCRYFAVFRHPMLTDQRDCRMGLVDQTFETIWKIISWRHFTDIHRHANKLKSLLNLTLEEQRNRSGILSPIAHKESKGLHLILEFTKIRQSIYRIGWCGRLAASRDFSNGSLAESDAYIMSTQPTLAHAFCHQIAAAMHYV